MYHSVSRVDRPDLVRLILACLTVVTTLPVGIRLVALVGGLFLPLWGDHKSQERGELLAQEQSLSIPGKPYHAFSIPGKPYHIC